MSIQLADSLRNNPGSVGETARSFADLFVQRSKEQKLQSLDVFLKTFDRVIEWRCLTHTLMRINDENLFFPEAKEGSKRFREAIEEVVLDNNYTYLLDLPTMILYAMLYESNTKREGMAAADRDFQECALRVIHQEVKKIASYQVISTESGFISCNLKLNCILDSSMLEAFLININEDLKLFIALKQSGLNF